MGPASQTLEAMRGEAVSNPDRFFDGMDSRVTSPMPIYYAPLPAVTAAMPGDTTFDSRSVAPGLTIHTPMHPAKDSSSSSGSMGTVLMFALGAALVAAAVLLLLFL